MSTIHFNIGEESRPVVEDLMKESIKDSIFFEQYQNILKEIRKYISMACKEPQEKNGNCYHNDPCKDQKRENDENSNWISNDNINNIFSIIGERGSGKTSCMLSVAQFLKNNYRICCKENKSPIEIIDKELFYCLDIIDPSFFDDKNNIINLVIAQIFKKFSEQVKSSSNDNIIESKNNLINCFDKVQKNLSVMLNGKGISEDDGLESLVNLSAGVDLAKNIGELISGFLKFVCSDYLVIMVDDIDLQISNAYVMVEQIRKYLVLPNVIILMSVKLDQLSLAIGNNIKKALNDDKSLNKEMVDEMADRYLYKLIPLSHRFNLPDGDVFMEDYLDMEGDSLPSCAQDPITESGGKVLSKTKEKVPSLIFGMTRFLFYNTKGLVSYIVPKNLRELRHLINLLCGLQEPKKDTENEKRVLDYNKQQFQAYFFGTWLEANLDSEGQKDIRNLLKVTDAAVFNHIVIVMLKKQFREILADDDKTELQKEIRKIIQDKNISYNISLGDVMGIIYYLEKTVSNLPDLKFLFVLKSIYSMKLYEYYDELTEKYHNKGINPAQESNSQTEEVYRIDILDKYSNYSKLIGGNFINFTLTPFLPTILNKTLDSNRGRRVINGEIFNECIDAILKTSDSDNFEKEISINYKNRKLIDIINIVEFFILTISRTDDSKGRAYRTERDVYYSSNMVKPTINYYFDVASIFYNLIDYKNTVKRFNDEDKPGQELKVKLDSKLQYYDERVEGVQMTLIGLIRRYVYKDKDIVKRHDDPDWNYLSWICIRNAEVLQSLVEYLQQNQPKGSGDNAKVMKDLFKNIFSFEIFTYDYKSEEEGEHHYKIKFPYSGAVRDFLSGCDPEFFDSIFIKPEKEELNIKIGLQKRGKYSRDKISRLLKNKNKEGNMIIINNLIEKYFNSNKNYDKSEASDILSQIKEEYEKTNND